MLDVRLENVPVVQRIERGFPKAKRAFLLVFAPVIGPKQNAASQSLVTTSVSSAVITNAQIFVAGVTQTGDTNMPLEISAEPAQDEENQRPSRCSSALFRRLLRGRPKRDRF
jgi:hypothetical protein